MYKIRIGTIDELDDLVEVEMGSFDSPSYYLRDNAKYFFEDSPGDMFVVDDEDDKPIGIGRYATLPDNSGWLETLRVKREFQGRGAGKMIYLKYLEKAAKDGAGALRMYTEAGNVVSKGLAELNGFTLSQEFYNMIISTDVETNPADDFVLVREVDELDIESIIATFGKYISLNRTFYEINKENLQWMIDQEMVYSDGVNIVVVGARMLRERGLFLGLVYGDTVKCIEFGIARARELGSANLTAIFPIELEDYRSVLQSIGFEDIYNLLVMERIMK